MTATAPQIDQPDRGAQIPTSRPRRVSAWNLVIVGICGLGVAISAYANVDADIYWHRILGMTWLSQGSFDLSSDPIAYTEGVRDWFPTSWLPEVVYALVVDEFGYAGILTLRFVLALTFFGLLARYLLHQVPAWLAAVCLIPALSAALVLQDRPQTFSLVFCAAALPTVHQWIFTGRTPGLVPAALVTWAWANFHGLWILVPALFVLAAVTDRVARRDPWRHSALGALACAAAAALTPVGPKLLISPLLVSGATGHITEWQATSFRSPVSWGFGLMLALCLLSFARGRSPSTTELVAVVALAAFGFAAYRNTGVASVLLLPVIASRLLELSGHVKSRLELPRILLLSSAVVTVGLLGLLYSRQDVVPDGSPNRIASALSRMGDVRVLAPYNQAGYIREFGGDGVRVAIDGRADRYGEKQIGIHLALMDGQEDWRAALADANPDVVVLDTRRALDDLLIENGWTVTVRDGDFALLEPRT